MIYFLLFVAISSVIFAYIKKSLTFSGLYVAIFIGVTITITSQEAGILSLLLFFISSSIWSRFKKNHKIEVEKQFQKTGERDGFQVLANGATGAIFSIAYFMTVDVLFMWGVIASFATANADTWATELGVLNKQNPISLRTLERVAKGSSGAVSLYGCVYSFLGSAFVVFPALGIFLTVKEFSFLPTCLFLTLIGFFGCFIDSLLGAFFQALYKDEEGKESEKKQKNAKIRGFTIVNNDFVNFASIFLSACIAFFFGKMI